MTAKLLYVLIDFVMPLILGYYCSRKHWLSEKTCNRIIMLNITVFCTVLSILSFWALPLSIELLWLPLFGILLSVIPGIIAYLVSHKKYEAGPDRASYLASAILSNIGTLGGLCTFFLYGEAGFAYVQIIALFQNLVFFLFCFPMAEYYNRLYKKDHNARPLTFSTLFFNRNQLPVAGLAIGMMLYLGGVPRPAVLSDIFNALIHISAWTALFPAGYSINFSAMKNYYGRIADLVPIKFIATPFLAYLLARILFNDPIVSGTVLLSAATPTGINAIVLARLYDLNLYMADAAFILTTGIFLAAVYPLLFLLLM